jgi:hypothetical protein
MSTVSEISEALKNALTTVPGLRVYDYLPDQVNPPLGYVGIQSVNYHGAFRGGNPVHTYTITIVIGRVNERTSQRALDDFLSYDGDRSIRAALEADPTLDGYVQTLIVTDGGNLAPLTMGDVTYVSIDFSVTVYP